MRKKSDSTVN